MSSMATSLFDPGTICKHRDEVQGDLVIRGRTMSAWLEDGLTKLSYEGFTYRRYLN